MSILQWMATRRTKHTNNNNTNSTSNSRNSMAILSSMLGTNKIRAISNNRNNLIISCLYFNNHNSRDSTRLLHKLINKFLKIKQLNQQKFKILLDLAIDLLQQVWVPDFMPQEQSPKMTSQL